jgi:hypothetical protein
VEDGFLSQGTQLPDHGLLQVRSQRGEARLATIEDRLDLPPGLTLYVGKPFVSVGLPSVFVGELAHHFNVLL